MAGLVGHQHPSVFHLVSVLQQDAALAETLIVEDARGQAPAKRPKDSGIVFSNDLKVRRQCED